MRESTYFVVLRCFLAAWARQIQHDPDEVMSIKTQGDVMFGALFPMHADGTFSGSHCDLKHIKGDRGIQRLEALLYAVDEINRDPHILPGITIGLHILDSCSHPTHALEQTLEFIIASMATMFSDKGDYVCPNGGQPRNKATKAIAAVIGAADTKVSIMVAHVLRLFKIPQISYSSTGIQLSDKSKFDYFARVVPPDNLQVEALADIVKFLGWSYVSVIVDEGDDSSIESFRKAANSKNICLAAHEKVRPTFQAEDFIKLVTKLTTKDYVHARGVVVFAGEDNVAKILYAVKELNLVNYFAWLASDNWGKKRHPVNKNPDAAEGAITILPKQKRIDEFDDYFTSLTLANNERNVWFKQFWRQTFNCSDFDSESCSGQSLKTNHVQEGYVPSVIDAVYLAAIALHNLSKAECGKMSLKKCFKTWYPRGEDYMRYIKNTTFDSKQGTKVQLDENLDLMGSYIIYQFRSKQYVEIGEWNQELSLNLSQVTDNYGGQLPLSICALPCKFGEVKKIQQVSCCWVCVPCHDYQYIINDTCVDCPLSEIPNINKTDCVPLIPLTMEWLSPWSVIPATFAGVGILVTTVVVYVFIRFNKTPIIMASGRELCYIMLAGIFCSYAMTFALIAEPTAVICAVLRVGLGLCLCICYAAILTKTNRLARIFTSDIRSAQRPRCITPRYQVIICTCLISVQPIGAIVWMLIEPPGTSVLYPDRQTAVLSCHESSYTQLIPLAYNLLLIILCTLYAFKTRKIPENFNETKHIGFTCYSTCIVWLAFVPIYFGTTHNFRIQITSLCLCVSISATVFLVCFFAPKVYVCLFEPQKNIRQGTTKVSLQKAQYKAVTQQMKFVRNSVIRRENQPQSLAMTTLTTGDGELYNRQNDLNTESQLVHRHSATVSDSRQSSYHDRTLSLGNAATAAVSPMSTEDAVSLPRDSPEKARFDAKFHSAICSLMPVTYVKSSASYIGPAADLTPESEVEALLTEIAEQEGTVV